MLVPFSKTILRVMEKVRAGAVWIPSSAPIQVGSGIQAQGWQAQAWRIWRCLGEVHYPTTHLARQLGRLAWHVSVNGVELPADAAAELLDEVTNGLGPRDASTAVGLNLQVAGEAWYLEHADGTFGVYSVTTPKLDEMVESSRAGGRIALRVYFPDPVEPQLADSAMRTAIGPAEELLTLSSLSRSQSRSRIAQAGVTIVNSGVKYGDADPFGKDFQDASEAAIKDVEHPAAMVPIKVEVPDEYFEKAVKHVTFDRPYDDKIPAKIEAATKRVALALDIEPTLLLGTESATHWCVDDQTEILTAGGWRRQDAVAVGNEVLTLNHTTGLSEWQPVKDMYRAVVHDEPMVSFESRRHSSLTTLNHRWPVVAIPAGRAHYAGKSPERVWRTSETLRSQDRVVSAAPHADIPTIPKYDDDLVELVGWFWTEGSVRPSGRCDIIQSHTRNPERVDRIRGALTRLFGPGRDTLVGFGDAGWRESIKPPALGGACTVFSLNIKAGRVLTEVAPNKRPSFEFVRSLTRSQLELFIEVSAQGDGQHYRSGRLDLWQRRSVDLDAYELAMVLSGRAIHRHESEGGWRIGDWKESLVAPVKAAQNHAGAATREEVAYSGVIWCPVTDNQTWLARRNGTIYYTGNTAWLSALETYTSHLEPLAFPVGELYAQVAERLFLRDLGLEVDVRVWPNAKELLAKRSTVRDALDAAKLGAVGLRYVRDAIGATDEDAPTEEELEVLRLVPREPGRDVAVDETVGEATPSGPDPVSAALTPRVDVAAAVTLAVAVARGKAGAKIRTRLRSTPDHALIDGVPNGDVVATLGHTGEVECGPVVWSALEEFRQWWDANQPTPGRDAAVRLGMWVMATLTAKSCDLSDGDLIAELLREGDTNAA